MMISPPSPGGHLFAQAGAQVIYSQALREQNPVHRSFRWYGDWAFLWGIRRWPVPQLWPLARSPRLGDPSEPSLVP
jgi:hypothetical protein